MSDGFDLTVYCHESSAPGTDWHAFVAFQRLESGFAVFVISENGDAEKIDTVADEFSLRSTCLWLARSDEVALWGDFRHAVHVEGGFDDQDLIVLAWLREWEFEAEAKWLVGLPTTSAAKLRELLGPLTDDDVLSTLRDYLEVSEDDPVQDLLDSCGNVRSREDGMALLSSLTSRKQKERDEDERRISSEREHSLSRFATDIENLVSATSPQRPRTSNWAVGLAHTRHTSDFRRAIERFVVEYDRLPSDSELASIRDLISFRQSNIRSFDSR